VDAAARHDAVDPARNVVLEASAGTGKTQVLVDRYVNLLLAGVDPQNILAITFTRKPPPKCVSASSYRLKEVRWVHLSEANQRRRDLDESTPSVCRCYREFPLEADVDPGFELADDTEVPRLVDEALDGALRICRARAREDEDVALVFAELGERRLRAGLAVLVDRRGVAPDLLRRYLAKGPKDLTAARACQDAARRLRQAFDALPDGLDRFLADGPVEIAPHLRCWPRTSETSPHIPRPPYILQSFVSSWTGCVRTFSRNKDAHAGEVFPARALPPKTSVSADAWKRHRDCAVRDIAPAIAEAAQRLGRDLNVVMARGAWRIYLVALDMYRREARGARAP